MELRSELDTVLEYYLMENGEWNFIGLTARDRLHEYINAVIFTFKIKRKPMFLLITVVLPILFMAVISVFVFVLPPESGERISFSITVLLALVVFFTLISENLPKTSKSLSHLSIFLSIILVYSVVMCISAVCNLRIYFTDEKRNVPHLLASIVNFIRCKQGSPRQYGHAEIEPNQDQVVLGETKVTEKPQDNQEYKAETSIRDQDVTWKNVSSTIDVLCVLLFSFAVFITTVVYLYILSSNA